MSKREPYVFKSTEASPPVMWRSLEEKRQPEQASQAAEAEFSRDTVDPATLTRRDFVSFAGLSATTIGLAGCIRRPEEKILPYAQMPEHMVLGVPNFYATVLPRGWIAPE